MTIRYLSLVRFTGGGFFDNRGMEKLLQENWTHYLYRILFEDGSYYVGVSKRKSEDPNEDGYFGSPVTNRSKWRNTPHIKRVLAYLWCSSYSDACKIEKRYFSLLCLKKDPNCLNGLNYIGRKKDRSLRSYLKDP